MSKQRTPGQTPGQAFCVLGVVGKCPGRGTDLHLCFKLPTSLFSTLDDVFDLRIQTDSVDEVELIIKTSLFSYGCFAGKSYTQLIPRRSRREDRNSTVHKTSAREIPQIIIMPDIEPSE